MQPQEKSKKIYIVDGVIDMRFAVSESSEGEAGKKAEQLIRKVMETEVLSSFGWSFSVKQIKEAKPIE